MAHQTTVIFLIICRNLIFFHISKNFFNNRVGYFCLDNRDAQPGHLVFNRSVSLKDSFKKK